MDGMVIKIALAVLSIVSTLVSALLIPYLRSKTSAETRRRYLEIVTIAVKAAEQIFRGSKTGREKKDYVLKRLKEIGIKLSEAELNMLIEASVKELNLWQAEA